MKYIISESQHRRLIESVTSETIKKVSTNWFKKQISRGEDPHIDGSLLMFLGIKVKFRGYIAIMDALTDFLGIKTAYNVGVERSKKIFDTNDYPNIAGGYDFKFTIDLNKSETTQLEFDAKILPGGEVTLVMTDDTTHEIKDIINDENIGWEIENEIGEIIDEIVLNEISHYSGFFTIINDVKLT